MRNLGLAIWLEARYQLRLGRPPHAVALADIATRSTFAASPLIQMMWRDALRAASHAAA